MIYNDNMSTSTSTSLTVRKPEEAKQLIDYAIELTKAWNLKKLGYDDEPAGSGIEKKAIAKDGVAAFQEITRDENKFLETSSDFWCGENEPKAEYIKLLFKTDPEVMQKHLAKLREEKDKRIQELMKELGRYFRIITTFFKYGIQEIDVLMFDADVQGKPFTLKEAKKNLQEFKVQGRGGTNFQAPVDYVKEHPDYDGLIIITDGYAPTPDVPPHLKAKLLWVIDNEASYQQNGKALRKTGRVCLMEL